MQRVKHIKRITRQAKTQLPPAAWQRECKQGQHLQPSACCNTVKHIHSSLRIEAGCPAHMIKRKEENRPYTIPAVAHPRPCRTEQQDPCCKPSFRRPPPPEINSCRAPSQHEQRVCLFIMERQPINRLGYCRRKQYPPQISPKIPRMRNPFRNAKGKKRKGKTPDRPQPNLVREENSANMIDQHGNRSKNL